MLFFCACACDNAGAPVPFILVLNLFGGYTEIARTLIMLLGDFHYRVC
jgi:hypothetical protein